MTHTNEYEPRIFDGPALVMPENLSRRVTQAAGLPAGAQLSMLDLSGVLLMVVVTDDEQMHVGGPTTPAERLELLRQCLAGLEALQ